MLIHIEQPFDCYCFISSSDSSILQKEFFVLHRIGYGCSDSFPFDFEPNGVRCTDEDRKSETIVCS